MSFSGTLLHLLQAAPASSTAIILPEDGIKVSYSSLREQVFAMADALFAFGIHSNDRIASALPNGLAAIVTFLAGSFVATAAPLNPAYRTEEFRFFLEDTSARVLICPPHGAEEARLAATELGIPVLVADGGKNGTVRLVEGAQGASAVPPSAEDIALVLHTSGSTGRPKRVPLRHANIAASAHNVASTYNLCPDDVSLCVMPLFHVHGLVASTLATLFTGGTVVVPAKFNALRFWRLVSEHKVTWYSAVPTIHQVVLARAGSSAAEHRGTLRFIRSCSAALPPHMMMQLEGAFNVPVLEAYGMTEAAHQMSSNPLPPWPRVPGSVGPAAGSVRISVMDDHGTHLSAGERGAIVIQGPNVFAGYENNPEANAASFVNGWFRTGDQGFMDAHGYLHVTARLKELINRGGEKIAPRRIDEVLLRHPAVADAVTFGFPHSLWGEEVAAAVVLREPQNEAELLKFCREHLAEFECPKKLYVVDSIPKTATGKIQRGAVASALVKEPSAA